jgi:hypothetical protein
VSTARSKDRPALLIAVSGLAGVLLASVITAGNSLYLDHEDRIQQKRIIQLQSRQSDVSAHNDFTRAQQYAAYTRAQLDLGNFAKAAQACVVGVAGMDDAFSYDTATPKAAAAHVEKQIFTPLTQATSALVDVTGAIDIIASDAVRPYFDNLQNQSQIFNNKCREFFNSTIISPLPVRAGGGNSAVATKDVKDLVALANKLGEEYLTLASKMRADLALK